MLGQVAQTKDVSIVVANSTNCAVVSSLSNPIEQTIFMYRGGTIRQFHYLFQ